MQVCSYIRVSTKGQLEEGGPDRQRDAIARFCQQHALEIVSETVEAISGTKDSFDRPGFARMLLQCREEKVAGIVVERLDRLARELLVQEILLRELRRAKIKLYSADSATLTDYATADDDPGRIAVRQILGAMAQYEKSMLVRRLRLGRERLMRKQGYAGPMAFGLKNARERATMDYLLALAAEQPRPTYRELARRMNESGLATRKGQPWSGPLVYTLLETAERRKKLLGDS